MSETKLLPCPVCGGEAIHAIDALKRVVIMPERLWCKACGTVTRDQTCDCNRWHNEMSREPNFVNYADAMQETAHEQAQRIEALEAALNYVADMTYCGTDAEWHFKPGYDPQGVLDAIDQKAST
jgi:hypothetical protein